MLENYAQALKLVLVYEGGYTNDPRDPGGPTNFGIIQREYDNYRKRKNLPTRSVRYIEENEYSEIYHEQYANPLKFDEMPSGLDFAVLDYGINSGIGKATKDLQRYLGCTVDGVLGSETLDKAFKAMAIDAQKTIIDYCLIRMNFLRSLSTFDHFGTGWTRRVEGARFGFQTDDTGVVDYAIMMYRRTPVGRFKNNPAPAKGSIDPVNDIIPVSDKAPEEGSPSVEHSIEPTKIEVPITPSPAPAPVIVPAPAPVVDEVDRSNDVKVVQKTVQKINNVPWDGSRIGYAMNSPLLQRAGETAFVLSKYKDWCYVQLEQHTNVKGWIHSKFLK